MYLVTFRETPDSEHIVVHAPAADGVKLVSGNINQGINDIDSFDLEIDFSNNGYNHIKAMQTLVEVLNVKNNRIEFNGRILNYADSMTSDGVHAKSVICEGSLGFLHDSSQPYIDYSGTAEGLFIQLINNHNSQVEDYKKFQIGTVSLKTVLNKDGTVAYIDDSAPSMNVAAFITPEKKTFENVKDNLLNVCGGEIQVRIVGSLRYIDYVLSIGHDSLEDINISHNLRSVTKKVDPSSIITRLIPLGKNLSTDTITNEKRLTIESVNNNMLYIERQDLKDEFGIQYGTVTWDDVTDPLILISKGVDWLNSQRLIYQQFTVEAIDLFQIGKGIEEYIVGNTHKIINPIMSVNERIRIVNKKVDIVNPTNNSLTIGDKFKTLIDYQMEQRNATKVIGTIQYDLKQQNIGVNKLNGELLDIQNTLNDLQSTNSQIISFDII
jgi:hypothetical protein